MAHLTSGNIKEIPTWIALLKEQKLVSEYSALEKRAKRAPNMVKNFVRELQKDKNLAQYDDFKYQIEQLILAGKVCQQDLDFINEQFRLSYLVNQLNFDSVSESSNSKGKHAADLLKQDANLKVDSTTIKKVETWISLLKQQSLKSRYDQFALALI